MMRFEWCEGRGMLRREDGTWMRQEDVEPIAAENKRLHARNTFLRGIMDKLLTALEDKRNRGYLGAKELFYAPSKSGHGTCQNIAKWLRAELREPAVVPDLMEAFKKSLEHAQLRELLRDALEYLTTYQGMSRDDWGEDEDQDETLRKLDAVIERIKGAVKA